MPTLPLTMDFICKTCRVRSGFTYVQSNLVLHSPIPLSPISVNENRFIAVKPTPIFLCTLQLFESIRIMVNPFPNNPLFLPVCGTNLLKTLWEKEKLLVTSNFPFSHCVFYPFGEPSVIYIKFEIVVCKTLVSLEVSKICHLGKG